MNKIKELFVVPFDNSLEAGFKKDIAQKSIFTARLLSPIILIICTYDLVGLFVIEKIDLARAQDRISFFMYLLLWAVTAVLGVFMPILAKHNLKNANRAVLLSYLYSAFICLWTTFILFLHIRNKSDSMAIYFAMVIFVAALAYLKPVQSIILFLLNHIIFIILFTEAYRGNVDIYSDYINVTVVAALAVAVSISRYVSARRVYRDHMMIVLKNQEIEAINRQLSELVHTDVLSGLHNRRFLDDSLPKLLENAAITQTPIAILMLDIDDFKALNDNSGHQAGDRCIATIASLLKEFTDSSRDYVMRYGGEEFAVIMPGVSLGEAQETAERIRAEIEALAIANTESPFFKVITVSIGLNYGIPSAECTLKKFFSRADKALYQAKKAGKNRVVVYEKMDEHAFSY